jgi:uncharacterized protein
MLVVWEKRGDYEGYEFAHVEHQRTSVTGVMVSVEPAMWVSYRLSLDAEACTRALHVRVRTSELSRAVALLRNPNGTWQVDGSPRPDLAEALDCDLAYCAYTNTMPIVRLGLLEPGDEVALTAAYVDLPSLEVSPLVQHYRHLDASQDGARVRYASGDFEAELSVDRDGLVRGYPGLAARLAPP